MNLPSGILLQGGKYRIVRFIGSGGFGCTYEAEHVMLEKRVAIKEFFVKDFCNRDETTSNISVAAQSKKALVEKLRSKFMDEAKSLFRLKHPGIVHVSDVFEENGTVYYVMDYIDGRSLQDIVASEGFLPESRAVKYIRQVADALGYVHSNNRLHLDIKPGNIMVDSTDNAILIDFGASKQYDEENGENTSTLLGRTPGYAPPEQMANNIVTFLPATDIYSLGATLYKLLTGLTPLDGSLRIAGEQLRPLPSETTAHTCKAVECSMELNKNFRPQSVREFLDILGDEPEQANSASSLYEQSGLQDRPQDSHEVKSKTKSSRLIAAICVIVGVAVALPFLIVPLSNGGHEWVDLGLSVKWATCNIGASASTDYGDYFVMGETKPISAADRTVTVRLRYLDDISGNTTYDAAQANWGGHWRMPTEEEFNELKTKCKWTWGRQDGHSGYKVTGPNGNSIFLPAAGWCDESDINRIGNFGAYWSSSLEDKGSSSAYGLFFTSESVYVYLYPNYTGRTIRPVRD